MILKTFITCELCSRLILRIFLWLQSCLSSPKNILEQERTAADQPSVWPSWRKYITATLSWTNTRPWLVKHSWKSCLWILKGNLLFFVIEALTFLNLSKDDLWASTQWGSIYSLHYSSIYLTHIKRYHFPFLLIAEVITFLILHRVYSSLPFLFAVNCTS